MHDLSKISGLGIGDRIAVYTSILVFVGIKDIPLLCNILLHSFSAQLASRMSSSY